MNQKFFKAVVSLPTGDKRWLLGGVKQAVSIPFEHKADAEQWARITVENNIVPANELTVAIKDCWLPARQRF